MAQVVHGQIEETIRLVAVDLLRRRIVILEKLRVVGAVAQLKTEPLVPASLVRAMHRGAVAPTYMVSYQASLNSSASVRSAGDMRHSMPGTKRVWE
jgi:hypothetical protein